MAGQTYYGSGAIMSAGFDLNSQAPLDYKSLIASWNNSDIDVLPLTALYVGMRVSDNTSGTVKVLKAIPSGATKAHECTWEEIGAHIKPDWNAASGTAAEILNKPSLATVATSGSYSDLSGTPTLATVATSGSYTDLSNTPTIPAAQVNSDWNASSGVAEILNKPTITDEKVKLTRETTNSTYPLLASAQSSPTSGTAYEAVYDATIKVNPSKHSLSLGESTEATGGSSHAEGNAGYWYEGTGLMVTGVSDGAFVLNGDPTNIISVGDLVRYKNMKGTVTAVTSSSVTISTAVHMEDSAELELRTMRHNIASGEASHAEGLFTTASGQASHAEGCNTTTSSSYSHAEGYGTKTVASSAHAEGRDTVAAGIHSHSAGVGRELSKGTVTLNGTIITFTTAPKLRIGNILRLSDQYRCVIACTSDTEYEVNVAFSSSLSGETIYLVEGVAYGADSTSFGLYCTATSRDSFAEGYSSIAHGADSHAEGRFTYTCAEAAHAECNNTIAGKDSSHAEGWVTATLETGAHAEGGGTLALGGGSHAEGRFNIASGASSHSEGGPESAYKLDMEATNIAFNFRTLTFTTSVSVPSYATFVVVKYGDVAWDESYYAIESISSSGTTCTVVIKDIYCGFKQTSALNIFLYVANNIASGNSSHAEGVKTTAQNLAEHAEGSYNVSHKASTTYADPGNTQHSVGIGTSGSPKNAFEITQNGDAYFYGIGNYDGTTLKASGNSIKTLKDVLNDKLTGVTYNGTAAIVTSGVAAIKDNEVVTSSLPTTITYSTAKYIKKSLTGGTFTITVDTSGTGITDNGAKEIIYRIDNSTSDATITVTGGINMFDADLSTGMTLPAGKTMELVFTFWSPTDVTFNGGISV